MLSKHSTELKAKLNINGKPSVKLVPNLFNKTKYVLYYRNLKLYLPYGMKLFKINWLKPYIELNTKVRKEATTDFEKDFFKLMNNSVFGKTMEHIFNRLNVELHQNACAKYSQSQIFSPSRSSMTT